MSSVREVLISKGGDVWTIGPDDMVLDAIRIMSEQDIGAVVVADEQGPIGIFTERHYARNVFLKGRSSPTTPVRRAMRTGFQYVTPEQTIEDCMALMTEHKVRHLPVMEKERLIGIISMGDLVKHMIADREFMIEQLTNYIAGAR